MAADGYGMDAVTTRLDQATTTLGRAQVRMAFAMRRAEYWRDEFAGHELPGLGASCEQIRDAAETVHDQAGSLIDQIGEQSATAATVTDTTEPEQVISTLTPVEGELRTLSAHCRAGTNRCADLAALIARNLAGGQPEWLLEQAGAAESAFDATRHHIDTATTYVHAAITYAHQAGTDDNTRQVEARMGPPAPAPDERAGAMTMAGIESDADSGETGKKRNLAARLNRLVDKTFKDADAYGDAAKTSVEDVQRGLSGPPPTICSTTVAEVQAEPVQPQNFSLPDSLQAIVVVSVASIKAIGLGMRHYKLRRKGHHDNADR